VVLGRDLEDRMREVLEAANRFNVTINVVDPRGLTSTGASDTLWRLSGETAGRAILNSNDLARGLTLASRDASAYYLLGYVPSQARADGKFHRIEVKVVRRGVRVLARKGYWAPKEEDLTATSAPEIPAEVRTATDVFARLEGGRLATTWWGFEPGPGGSTRAQLSWQPIRSAAVPAARPSSLTVTARDAAGRIVIDQRVAAARSGATRQAGRRARPARSPSSRRQAR